MSHAQVLDLIRSALSAQEPITLAALAAQLGLHAVLVATALGVLCDQGAAVCVDGARALYRAVRPAPVSVLHP